MTSKINPKIISYYQELGILDHKTVLALTHELELDKFNKMDDKEFEKFKQLCHKSLNEAVLALLLVSNELLVPVFSFKEECVPAIRKFIYTMTVDIYSMHSPTFNEDYPKQVAPSRNTLDPTPLW